MFLGKKTAADTCGAATPRKKQGPPDSERPFGHCPSCKKQSSFEYITSLPLTFDGIYLIGNDQSSQPTCSERITLLICCQCDKGVVVFERCTREHGFRKRRSNDRVSWSGSHWWLLASARSHPAIPGSVATAFNESVLALATGCPRAAAITARRGLEAVAAERGEVAGTLMERLGRLCTKGLSRPSVLEWTKEVQLAANVVARLDRVNAICAKDAQQLVEFLRELLDYLYVMPWELDARGAEPR